jgi:hypothetical protein
VQENTMQLKDVIHQAYEKVTKNSLELWEAKAGSGTPIETPFYHPTKLAVSSGNRPHLCDSLLELLMALNQVAQRDPLVDVNPPQGVHFSFFPITRDIYGNPQDVEGIEQLQAIFTQHCANHVMHISQLRLVALPNQILLAGIPDEQSLRVRQRLADALLDSPWCEKVRARYPSGDIPQLFWHSTLMRYSADVVSPQIREVFKRFQQIDFGEVQLPVQLVLCSYNWQRLFTLA